LSLQSSLAKASGLCVFCRRYDLFGLYDTEGMLRFTCTDKEACIAYAKLFDLSSIEFSLMPLSENIEKEEDN
tara:strand:+ start:625 stop:840 length:216 start_codon:yes stop_codon:yes gene_type:complete